MRLKRLLWALAVLYLPLVLQAQEKKDTVMKFSLEEAKTYALVNSPVIKNATLDLEAAKKKIWETTAIGLPQVNAKFAYSYMPTLSPTILEFSNIGNFFAPLYSSIGIMNNGANQAVNKILDSVKNAAANAPKVTLDDLKWNATLDVTVSQLIFSGAYLVGLQTSKIYKGLSQLALTKSQYDLNESVTNAYFLVLVARENKTLLDTTYLNTLQILNNMKKMFEQGFVEETDVQQLQLTTNTIKFSADMIGRQIGIAERLLKFQMGLDLNTTVILKDSINGLLNSFDNNNILLQNFTVENNVDYKLMDTQAKLMKMNLLLNKSTFLPDIAGFYQHENVYNKNALTFNPPQLIGISASLPIFTSGSRIVKVAQARISYDKALNSKQLAADGLKMSFEESKSSYQSAIDNFKTAKENLKLSEKIYRRSIIKKQEGTISSVELTQTQNQYLQSQSNYFNSIITLASAKAKLEKLLISAQ